MKKLSSKLMSIALLGLLVSQDCLGKKTSGVESSGVDVTVTNNTDYPIEIKKTDKSKKTKKVVAHEILKQEGSSATTIAANSNAIYNFHKSNSEHTISYEAIQLQPNNKKVKLATRKGNNSSWIITATKAHTAKKGKAKATNKKANSDSNSNSLSGSGA